VSGTELKQRLAAILAADVAGYSRLMAADERATVAALDASRAVFRKQIEANRGRVIDMAGDSVLAVFDTATGAVTAAIAIQETLATTSSAEPEDRRMRFRIGVHLGDVIEKADGTVYGDGVNIAARLEGLAEPGGITVSDSVRNAVRGKVNATFEDQGEQAVKNIAEPVRAYAVRAGRGASAKPLPAASRLDLPPPDRLSIAVLPFANMSENKDNAYFADGMHEELLTQLALLGELKVVSRTSVTEYRDSKKNIRQIAAELGVLSLVEGSVRLAGNRVRVTAQLIDADSDTHAWGRSFDRDLTDIFAIQSELATEIARALKVTLSPEEKARIDRKPTDNLAAYDLFLRHQELTARSATTWQNIHLKERIALLSQAIELDPNFALAWAYLGANHARAYYWGEDRSSACLAQAKHAIERALTLAPGDIEVHIQEAHLHHLATNDYGRAGQLYEIVLRSAPNNVEALTALAHLRWREMQWTESATYLEKALAIDPRNVVALGFYARHLANFRHFDRALAVQQQLIDVRPNDLSLKCEYLEFEFKKTGSWESFDKWRATLPTGTERTSFELWDFDVFRAGARRDFNSVIQLLGTPPIDLPVLHADLHSLLTATAHFVNGNRSQAIETARTALQQVTAKLECDISNDVLWMLSASYRAILGERDTALAEFRRARELTLARKDLSRAAVLYGRHLVRVYMFLGDREQAFAELSRILRLPASSGHWSRVDWTLASLWGDPGFQAVVNDPAHNAPLPFNLKDSYAMGEIQTPPICS